jgi:hypothetical protein
METNNGKTDMSHEYTEKQRENIKWDMSHEYTKKQRENKFSCSIKEHTYICS